MVTLTVDGIIKAGTFIGAVGALVGVLIWCFKFVERQKRQDKELSAIREENTLICYGVMACLKGLKEQGCDGPVTDALDKMEKHLNQAAHVGGA